MNKQELLESIENMGSEVSENYPHDQVVDRELIIKLVEGLDEPDKVVIPQFVAEAFEKAKWDNVYAEQLITTMYDSSDEVGYWLEVPSNEKLLLRAWLDGYEIEKEKEKLYYTVDGKGQLVLFKSQDRGIIRSYGEDLETVLMVYEQSPSNMYQLTEKEIKGYDERFMAFAVEVAE